ncbi:cysteine-rich repeat secretory protein 56-like [Abrus precatorius]|uniref:Cysteine-rich repeat secretory protein 56-like n=1 Tax=Abrus precatorius TaxID=3816 RepID=A0A8B8MJ43_ABRPR|nr:cysteine-rich repeat secretory protein 56-like [Abrus precatorius]
MGMIRKRFSHPFPFLFTVFWFLLLHHPMSEADNTNLVYKGCADQKLHDPPSGIYSQNLKALLVSLVAQSAQKGFSTTTSGNGQNVIMGLYQCRGDLSNSACYNCVSKIPYMLDKLCGKVVAARIQLTGCYLRYEVVGFKQVPETQLLYKVCGAKQESDGFEERRDYAFGMVENGVKSGGNLFYTGSYQSLYVLGQCEGDLANDDCGDCMKSAEDQTKAECGDSDSAQIYLHKCFISYSYYSKGVSILSSSPGRAMETISSFSYFDVISVIIRRFMPVSICLWLYHNELVGGFN